jgi:hypothetical protein
MPYAGHPDTPVDLTGASNYLEVLPGFAEAKQSAIRLCKSTVRCFWKHMQLWKCIEDALRLDL